MSQADYSSTIAEFLQNSEEGILGRLAGPEETRGATIMTAQVAAWRGQIQILRKALKEYNGKIYFEFIIPRIGGRIDVVLLIKHVIFVVEFKVHEGGYQKDSIDQVRRYGRELKNFHDKSHEPIVAPILVATDAENRAPKPAEVKNGLLEPLLCNAETLPAAINAVLDHPTDRKLDLDGWESGDYLATPTIIEAAQTLYRKHKVLNISHSEAEVEDLDKTSDTVADIIKSAKEKSQKIICFVTGVPGAGKTLVGLNTAIRHTEAKRSDQKNRLHSVFLSGNAPLVDVLREALAQDNVLQEKKMKKKDPMRIGEARSEVKSFIQNIHRFRDGYIKKVDDKYRENKKPPPERVVVFDEGQRMWDKSTLSAFMLRRKGIARFEMSEPEVLLSFMDNHTEWAVIVCLVGGGQEIGRGESGISGWIDALKTEKFNHWQAYVSDNLQEPEYDSDNALADLAGGRKVFKKTLHLATSKRSFRADKVSLLVKQILDLEKRPASDTLNEIAEYPIVLTRDFAKAKQWVRDNASGMDRYGMVVSSNAERLKPYAVDVRPRIKPVNWFLKGSDDVRSSYYLEDVATEFEIQGLELDWACMAWDADFRYDTKAKEWRNWEFRGSKWQGVKKPERQEYQKNAYRVLLTRARQGMVIVVPEGDTDDKTRDPQFYDPTFNYLKDIGFEVI